MTYDCTIFIIGESPILLTILKEYILQYGFKNITTLDSPQNAIAIIKETPPDIIVVESEMVYISGLELVRFSQKMYPKIKGVIYTSEPFSLETNSTNIIIVDKGSINFYDILRSSLLSFIQKGDDKY